MRNRALLVPTPHCSRRRRAAVTAVVAALAAVPASHAEKADRFKPLNVEADLPGKIDLLHQFVVFNGNVVVTKGTMTIRADRIEVRELPDGYHTAVAFGSPGKHATFRQKRDVPDEYIAGDAERLEYDGKSDVIRFVNNASVRRLRGGETADEVSGNLVTYDSTTEVFSVSGGATPTATNPGGRIRVTLMPKEGTAAAAEAARAASAAASAPPQLRTAPALGGQR
jgi:lipopolysaccharide export system protein LptA